MAEKGHLSSLLLRLSEPEIQLSNDLSDRSIRVAFPLMFLVRLVQFIVENFIF